MSDTNQHVRITMSDTDNILPTSLATVEAQGQVVSLSIARLAAALQNWIDKESTTTINASPLIDLLGVHQLALQLTGSTITGSIHVISPAVRQVIYGSTRLLVNIPRLILMCRWHPQDYILTHSNLYICRESPANLASTIRCQVWPYANVYDDGHICWGSARTAGLRASEPLGPLELFFSTAFNYDLWRGGDRPVGNGTTPVDYSPAVIVSQTPFNDLITRFFALRQQ